MSLSKPLPIPTQTLDVFPRRYYPMCRSLLNNTLVALNTQSGNYYDLGIGRSPESYRSSKESNWARNNPGIPFNPANAQHLPPQQRLVFPPVPVLPDGASVQQREERDRQLKERDLNLERMGQLRTYLFQLIGPYALDEIGLLFMDRVGGINDASFEEIIEAFDSFAILRREDLDYIEINKLQVILNDPSQFGTYMQELAQIFQQLKQSHAEKSEVDKLRILKKIISGPGLASQYSAYIDYTTREIEINQSFFGAINHIKLHASAYASTVASAKYVMAAATITSATTTIATVSTRPKAPPAPQVVSCNGIEYFWCEWHREWNPTHPTNRCNNMARAKKIEQEARKKA